MSDRVEIDASEVRQFAVDLGDAAASIARRVRPVVSKGALKIRNQMREEASGSRHFRIAPTISYDLNETADGVEAEIGPNRYWRAARLANIAYFGGVHGGGGTIPDPEGALNAEIPYFEKALGDLGVEI